MKKWMVFVGETGGAENVLVQMGMVVALDDQGADVADIVLEPEAEFYYQMSTAERWHYPRHS
jgi:hypothetical protein